MTLSFEKYSSLARYYARSSNGKNFIFSEEDIYQELMTKLISSWDYVSQEESESGRLALVKAIFKNRVADIVNYCLNRPDTSIYSKEAMLESDENEGWIFDSSDNRISDASKFPNPESAAAYKELHDKLVEIKNSASDPDVKEYLSSILDDDSISKMEELKEKWDSECKRVSDGYFISPFVRARILGKSSSFSYRVMRIVERALSGTGFCKA